VRLLGLCQGLEPVSDFREAFIACGLREARIHIGVLVGFAVHGGSQVEQRVAQWQARCGIAHRLQIIEMTVRVAGLALSGVAEQAGDFRLSFDTGNLGKIEIAAIGLALASECRLEILVRFGSF
jgi:hypothetical protein